MRGEFGVNWPALVAYIKQSEARGERMRGDVLFALGEDQKMSYSPVRKRWRREESRGTCTFLAPGNHIGDSVREKQGSRREINWAYEKDCILTVRFGP